MPARIKHGLTLGPKLVQLSYLHDDLASLDVFHRRVIEQSFERVLCSGRAPYGVTVLP